MLSAIRDNTVALETISQDSRKQAGALKEVTVAVQQMDEMTQHNAALVEQTNAAIEQTEAQAVELDRIVEIFTLDNTPIRHPHAKPTTAALFSGARGMQDKLKAVAGTYLRRTNTVAAVDKDWSEF
jgi:hypothetical protein